MPDSQGHFQLFAPDERSYTRWRLLSANNRELGRGCEAYPMPGDCLLAIKRMVEQLDDLVAQTRRRDGNLWQWTLLADGVAVVVGGHAYDRQVRSQEAATRFRTHARGGARG